MLLIRQAAARVAADVQCVANELFACLFELWGARAVCGAGCTRFLLGGKVRAVFWCTCWMRRVQSF